jgi:Tfp pilus assembly protein PilO
MASLLEWFEVTPLRQKASLVGLLMILWGGVFYGWIAQPMMEERERLALRLQSLDRKIKMLSRTEDQYLAAQGELSQWKSLVNQHEARLGLDVPMSQVLSEMSNISQETGVNVTLWKPGESQENSLPDMKEQRLQLHVEGGFHHVARFLDHMQGLSKPMGVTTLSMHSADNANGIPMVLTTIDFIGYEGAAHTLADNSQLSFTSHSVEGRG